MVVPIALDEENKQERLGNLRHVAKQAGDSLRRKQTLGLLFTIFDICAWKLDKDPSFSKSSYKGQG